MLGNIYTSQHHTPFGSLMPQRFQSAGKYRFGFNGKEKDDEVKGSGNSYDFGARIYDSRIGKWLSLDPLAAKYPSFSPYSFVNNMPIWAKDPDGRDIVIIGSPEDQSRIQKSLLTLATKSGIGAEIVKAAMASNRTIVIVSSKEGFENSVNNANNNYEVMTIDLSSIGEGIKESDGRIVENNLETTLAHELSHFLSTTKGKILDENGNNTGISADEVKAVEVENQVRKELGMEERKEYGGINVYGKQIKESNKYSGYFNLEEKEDYAPKYNKNWREVGFKDGVISKEARGTYSRGGKYIDSSSGPMKRDAAKTQTRIYEKGNKNPK